jgi:hypothetical protein
VESSKSWGFIDLINAYNLQQPAKFFAGGKHPPPILPLKKKAIGSNGFGPNNALSITCPLAQLVIDNPMACQLNAASVYCNYKFADTYPQFILDQAKNFNNFKLV